MKTILFLVAALLCCPQLSVAAKQAKPAQQAGWVVRVNGKEVSQEAVFKRLWSSYGPQIVQTFIDEQLLRQEALRLKITVPPADIERLYAETERRLGKDGMRAEMLREGMTELDFRQRIELRLLTEGVVVRKAGIKVSDEDVKQFFEKEKTQLGRPESVRLSRILVATEKQAEDAIAKLKSGTSFADLASKISLDARTRSAGGNMGVVARGMLEPGVEREVFALPAGGVSRPIPDTDGYYVVKVDEKLPAEAADFAKMKDSLRDTVRGVKIRQALPGVMAELKKNAKIEFPGDNAKK